MQHRKTCAIIVAAGKSTRMGTDKQRIVIGEKTVIEHCVDNFQAAKHIDHIIIVTSKESLAYMTAIAPSKVCCVTEGGDSRQKSVSIGIERIPEDVEFVAIHDGARPFASPALIDAICECAYGSGASVPVIPITSTVKRMDADGNVVSTVDRDALRLVQTPQVFHLQQYKDALACAGNMDFTDDCQLFEKMNRTVTSIAGDEKNIKITTPDDLLLAQLIKQRMDEA